MNTDLLEPGEYEVHIIDLPPIERADIAGIVRNQIPVLHPGPTEKLHIHDRTYRTQTGWKVIVYLIPESRFANGARAYLPIDAVPKNALKTELVHLFIVGRDYIEHFEFASSAPQRVHFASKTRAEFTVTEGLCIVVDLHDSGWQPIGSIRCTRVGGETISKRNFPPINERRGVRAAVPGRTVRVAIAFTLFVASFVAVFETRIARATRELSQLRAEIGLTGSDDGDAKTEDHIFELYTRIQGIVSQKRYRPFAFLQGLAECVKSSESIVALEYVRGAFRIQVVVDDPLQVLRSITDHRDFTEVTSTTIAPDAQSDSRITISGRYAYDSS